MNSIKKLYCRAFQKCFHIALPILPYRKPNILDSVADISDVIRMNYCTKPLVITDKSIHSLGLTEEMEHEFDKAGMKYAIYDGVVANPTTDTVEEALKTFKNNHCDCLIGFGGGSSMDCAKAVGIRIIKPDKSLDDVKGILKIWEPLPLLIAVPTTAGTGSETTLASIIVDAKTRHKYAINSFPLIPHYAVLDPKVTKSLPPSITASTGLDALTHAVEAYIGNSTIKRTRMDSIKAVRLIYQYLDRAYENGSDLKARRGMLHASFFAGSAFTQSYVGYVHAIAHSLGGEYNIPHGLANAIILPVVLEAYGPTIDRKLHGLAISAGLADKNTPDEEAARRFIESIKEMKKRFGIGDTIPELKKEDIPRLAKYADKEANPLYPVPMLMDAKQLESLYYMLLE